MRATVVTARPRVPDAESRGKWRTFQFLLIVAGVSELGAPLQFVADLPHRRRHDHLTHQGYVSSGKVSTTPGAVSNVIGAIQGTPSA
jgi:hypothetical protein